MTGKEKIRVLIVDDSITARNLLKLLLSEDPLFEVIGILSNGSEAVEFAKRERPDVISMDIHMPVMNGFEATREIMEVSPVPIVIVSTAYNPNETRLSFQALEAGALTILPRPMGPGHPDFVKQAKNFRNTLKSLSEVRVVRRTRPPLNRGETKPVNHADLTKTVLRQEEKVSTPIVVIGASAGGPSALQLILQSVPSGFPSPILIVQHIDKGFAEGFAQWLSQSSSVPVTIPKDGDKLLPGHAYLPSGDHHLGLKGAGVVALSSSAPENGLRPSVSYLFRSAAAHYGSNTVAVLLSGMGRDGAKELKNLKEIGAFTLVQDSETALVYGMPGEALRLQASCIVLPPERMIQAILSQINSLMKH